MSPEDPQVAAFLRRYMTVRIATLSRRGRPSITPIYFTTNKGHIWVGTSDWTLAAREAVADPRVSLLFTIERAPDDPRTLRINGSATVHADRPTLRMYNLGVILKYMLPPAGLFHYLANRRLIPLMNRYHDQSAEKGHPCVIDITPQDAEFV